jgi:hypothetical protein
LKSNRILTWLHLVSSCPVQFETQAREVLGSRGLQVSSPVELGVVTILKGCLRQRISDVLFLYFFYILTSNLVIFIKKTIIIAKKRPSKKKSVYEIKEFRFEKCLLPPFETILIFFFSLTWVSGPACAHLD